MLTLAAASACDVCSDAYGPTVMPHSIPCGHSFCRTCLTTISERAPKGPVCPLCRETFDTSSIRVIRVDLSDPLPPLTYDNTPFSDDTDSDISDRGRGSLYPSYEARIRDEARALELRVAKAASIKCTFEEVSALHKEIQDWLLSDPRHKPASKFAALRLSAALLRAILLNSVAFTDANRLAKEKITGLESAKTTLEAEVRRQRQQYSEKVHECNALQAEVERLRRSPAPGFAPSVARSSPFPAPATPSPPPSSSTMPPPPTRTTPPNLASNLPSPLSAQSPTRNPPPRSVSTSPYSQGTPSAPSIHQRTQSLRSGQNSPTPAATAAAQQYLRNTQTSPTPPRTAVENLMYRSNPSALPRSMTAPPPPSPNTPPPIRTQTKPRAPLRSSHERWVPVIEETDVESSENHYTRARSNTIRAAPVRPIHA